MAERSNRACRCGDAQREDGATLLTLVQSSLSQPQSLSTFPRKADGLKVDPRCRQLFPTLGCSFLFHFLLSFTSFIPVCLCCCLIKVLTIFLSIFCPLFTHLHFSSTTFVEVRRSLICLYRMLEQPSPE